MRSSPTSRPCARRCGATRGRWRSRSTPRRRWPWAITSVGGKTRTDGQGQVEPGWDHDPPAKEKLVPFGILVLLTGALTLVFGSAETSDFWVDALQRWWQGARARYRGIKRLVIYLDNGKENPGSRTPHMER